MNSDKGSPLIRPVILCSQRDEIESLKTDNRELLEENNELRRLLMLCCENKQDMQPIIDQIEESPEVRRSRARNLPKIGILGIVYNNSTGQ